MSDELEVATMGAASAALTDGNSPSSDPNGGICRNCGADIHRKYCGACGQLAQNFHKPVLGLLAEILGDFFSLDGRVARTVPSLLFNPGSITRSYLDGKRQRYVPPFRLYLLASFIFFLSFFSFGQAEGWFHLRTNMVPVEVSADAEAKRAEAIDTVRTELADQGIRIGDVMGEPDVTNSADSAGAENAFADLAADTASDSEANIEFSKMLGANGKVDRDYLGESVERAFSGDERDVSILKSWANTLADIYDNDAIFFSAVRNAAPRLALALTPALMLCFLVVFPFRRGFYLYDHVIAALHFQTWLYLLFTFAVALAFLRVEASLIWLFLFLAPPIYMYRFFRKVYASGRILGFLRTMVVLFMLTVIFVIWLLAVFAFSAGETTELSRELTQN